MGAKRSLELAAGIKKSLRVQYVEEACMAEVNFRNQAEIVSWHHRNCGRQQQLFVEMERPGYYNLIAKVEDIEEMWNGTKQCVERMVGEAHLLRDKLEGRL
eukprot:5310417-Pleurochrysis_carterae.AAC.1